ADVVVMAAAVADFRPAGTTGHKIKKSDDDADPVLELDRNRDVLAGLVARRSPGQIVVGFAAETGDAAGSVLEHARAKLARKGCDLLVVNAVGEGGAFDADDNTGWLLASDGAEDRIPLGAKSELAATVWDTATRLLGGAPGS
ncbi:phosphopantothenoylcysteine decarboxylase, partial [Prauserella halophila]